MPPRCPFLAPHIETKPNIRIRMLADRHWVCVFFLNQINSQYILCQDLEARIWSIAKTVHTTLVACRYIYITCFVEFTQHNWSVQKPTNTHNSTVYRLCLVKTMCGWCLHIVIAYSATIRNTEMFVYSLETITNINGSCLVPWHKFACINVAQ